MQCTSIFLQLPSLHYKTYLFYNWNFVTLIPFLLFSNAIPTSSNHQYVLCITHLVFCFAFLIYITHVSEIIQYLFFLFLTYFTWYISLKFYLCCCKKQDFIIFMSEQDCILCMYYLIFNHSSIDGHLGCFHVLALVNNTVMNIDRKVSFLVFLPSLSKYPEVELLDHRIVLIVIFEEFFTAKPFRLVSFYFMSS